MARATALSSSGRGSPGRSSPSAPICAVMPPTLPRLVRASTIRRRSWRALYGKSGALRASGPTHRVRSGKCQGQASGRGTGPAHAHTAEAPRPVTRHLSESYQVEPPWPLAVQGTAGLQRAPDRREPRPAEPPDAGVGQGNKAVTYASARSRSSRQSCASWPPRNKQLGQATRAPSPCRPFLVNSRSALRRHRS